MGLIRNAATAVGVITGAGTIVGWIVSAESPAVVAGTAVGYAGMVYCGGFAVVSFVTALLPRDVLKSLEAQGNLAKPGFRARALYVFFGCFFAAFFVVIGTDPLDGGWIAIGAIGLAIVVASVVTVQRTAAAKREAEYQDCPDCAERIKQQARVCRYCGYRLAPPPPAPPEPGREVVLDGAGVPSPAGAQLHGVGRAGTVGRIVHRHAGGDADADVAEPPEE